MARRVTLNVPVRSTCMTLSQASGSISATGAVGPEIPALFTSTSSPPRESTASATMRSMSCRFETFADLGHKARHVLGSFAERGLVNIADANLGPACHECLRNLFSYAGSSRGYQYALRHLCHSRRSIRNGLG